MSVRPRFKATRPVGNCVGNTQWQCLQNLDSCPGDVSDAVSILCGRETMGGSPEEGSATYPLTE